VVSDRRIASTVPNLYKTTGFLADPDTALSYSGLGDYRAAAGENRQALIIAEESPRFWIPQIQKPRTMLQTLGFLLARRILHVTNTPKRYRSF
jgi:hypothetical protein